MRLTLFTDYSLRVLMVLASRRRELVTIADIAAAFDISHAHLMKVTHALARTGWVDTVRGRRGGMRLSVDPRALGLGEIVRTLEGDFALVECMSDAGACALTGGCGLASVLDRALAAFLRELDRHSLADLASTSPSLAGLSLWQPITLLPVPRAARVADRRSTA